MKRIYLDYAATTPIDKRVAKAMRDFELEYFGNPSSSHREGQNARAKIDYARDAVAKFINAQSQEIIFTSGATEANNLAIKGVVSDAIFRLKIKPHVITTCLEHQSVYNVIKEMEKRGVVEASFVCPTPDGQISAEDIIHEIKDNTVLISMIFVSNEIGSILPIRAVGSWIKDQGSKIKFHVDAVQAAKFYNCNVKKIGCDLLTLSAHKIYGPKGIGALFVKSGTKIDRLMSGGSQEYGKRPGTQNTPGIIGFAKAIELLGSLETRQKISEKISKLRDPLIKNISTLPNAELNGPIGDDRAADNISFIFDGVDQDSLVTALDLAGIAASTGSACVSGSSEPSYVIESLGKVQDRKFAATVRLTLGIDTTAEDIKYASKTLKEILIKLKAHKLKA